MKICLDPGHGGKDWGAVLNKDYSERELNLLVARRIKEPLIQAGHSVVWTRTGRDQYPSIDERPRIAKRAGCTLFVSVHCNAGPWPARGVECWYRNGDAASQELAQRWLRSLVEYTKPTRVRGIYPDTQNRHGRLGVLHGHPPGVRAILLEAGFISNAQDLLKLLSATYGLALGQALADVLKG